MKKLLIIGPKFHGYWHSIEQAFRSIGWDASSHLYDLRRSRSHRTMVKLGHELPQRLSGRSIVQLGDLETKQALKATEALRPDRVLVIKGDRLGSDFFDHLDEAHIPRTLWLYDELRRTKHTADSLQRFDAIATYSRQDAAALLHAGHRSLHVPLGYDPNLTFTATHRPEVTFIGARYPKRETSLLALHTAGVPIRAYGRDWSAHHVDRLRTWRLSTLPFPSGRDVSLTSAYGIMAGSMATLNIHGDQDGFTMRTFEAAGVGAVQLIDRADVSECYDPGTEVAVFSCDEELIDLASRAMRDPIWGNRLREAARARTIAEHTFVHRAQALEAQWA